VQRRDDVTVRCTLGCLGRPRGSICALTGGHCRRWRRPQSDAGTPEESATTRKPSSCDDRQLSTDDAAAVADVTVLSVHTVHNMHALHEFSYFFFFFSGVHHWECVAPYTRTSAFTEDGSGPGRLLRSV